MPPPVKIPREPRIICRKAGSFDFADDEAPGFPVSPAGAHQEQTLSSNLSFTDKTRVAQYGQKPRWSFPPMRF
jgi:hypothetical protein